jgi:Xaa-Pro aminopeptidase
MNNPRRSVTRKAVVRPEIGRAMRQFLLYLGMNDDEINAAIKTELKEDQMTEANYPVLTALGDSSRLGALHRQFEAELTAVGAVRTGPYFTLGDYAAAAEDLNSILEHLNGKNFQAWKALVNILRFVKAAEERRFVKMT